MSRRSLLATVGVLIGVAAAALPASAAPAVPPGPPRTCVPSRIYIGDTMAPIPFLEVFTVYVDIRACADAKPDEWTVEVAQTRVDHVFANLYKISAWVVQYAGTNTSRRFALVVRGDLCEPIKNTCVNDFVHYDHMLILAQDTPGTLPYFDTQVVSSCDWRICNIAMSSQPLYDEPDSRGQRIPISPNPSTSRPPGV